MNRTTSPTLPPGDDVDALLRDFFRKEMPAPRPAFQVPRERPVAPVLSFPAPAGPAPRRSSWRSRLALAASIALLIGSSALLPGRLVGPRSESRPIGIVPGTDEGKKDRIYDYVPDKGVIETTPAPKADSRLHLLEGPEGTGILIEVPPLPNK
jgi:hypothetical protein